MRCLLDTHAFLWWVLDDARLSATARAILEDGGNEVLLSAVSGYEIAVKAARGRLTLPEAPDRYVQSRVVASGFDPLPVTLDDTVRAATLPPFHWDPFDRVLVAQGQTEGIAILSIDPLIGRYDVETIW